MFESGAVETDEPAREIRLALVTCTYRREAEILRNLRILRRENREAGDGAVLEKIFVVDNAKSLLPEQMEDERIRLIPNANTGGSGRQVKGNRLLSGKFRLRNAHRPSSIFFRQALPRSVQKILPRIRSEEKRRKKSGKECVG